MNEWIGNLPCGSGKPDTVALGQAVGGAAAGVGGGEDIFVAGHAVGGGDGVVGAAGELREGHLDDLEACRRLPVPRPVERHVHVGRVGVERVPDRRAVRLEHEAGRLRLAGAVRVARDAVARREHELAARLQALEGLRAPDRETGRVAVPVVSGG